MIANQLQDNPVELAQFLHTRVEQTILYRQFVETVYIHYARGETFGNKYINIHYELALKDSYTTLPYTEQENAFAGSPHYTFSLSTYKDRSTSEDELLRIMAFKSVYESLCAYITIHLEQKLLPGTGINIMAIDHWPEWNYTENYMQTQLRQKHSYQSLAEYEANISQWSRLQRLSFQTRKNYIGNKKAYNITDKQLTGFYGLTVTDIRYILLQHDVPIVVKDSKIIDEVLIHTHQLVCELRQQLHSNNSLYFHKQEYYQHLIIYLYNHYLPEKKQAIIRRQQTLFLQNFGIKEGDVLELMDNRLVVANAVYFDEKEAPCIRYSMLKNDLQPSLRTRTVTVDKVLFVLSKPVFVEYTRNTPVRHLSILQKWMEKRKSKIVFKPFALDWNLELG